MPKEFKVDFIGIGVPRAGTTWLFKCLKEHPEICGSKYKETKFFQYNHLYEKGLKYYASLFKSKKSCKASGEFSPSYFYSSKAAHRIKSHNRDVKFIICLRNPIIRAYSYYFHKKNKKLHNESFGTLIRKSNNVYLEHGLYFKYLKYYLDLFSLDQFLFLIYEDFDKDPTKVVKETLDFLGVDNNFVPNNLNKRINFNVKSNYYFLFLRRLLDNVFNSGKSKVYQLLSKWNLRKNKKRLNLPPMNREDRKYLKKFFNEDIKKLEKIIGKSLSDWGF